MPLVQWAGERSRKFLHPHIFRQRGWLKDKFGISWQVISPEMNLYLNGSDPKGAQRATQAMLAMKKIDLAAMRQAYNAE